MDDPNRIDPAARFIARNARYWDPIAAFHLYEAISHELATFNAARERYAKLGLLIRLIADGTGEVPPVERYDGARALAKVNGESWPSRSDLTYAHGSWPKAVKAAMESYFGADRVPTSRRYARLDSLRYTDADIAEQIRACDSSIGFESNQWEYAEWARVARDLKRRAGQVPRIPGLKQIRKSFGSFDGAARVARTSASTPKGTTEC